MTSIHVANPLRWLFVLSAITLGACLNGGTVTEGGGRSTGSSGETGDNGDPGELCALQNCHSDADCGGCSGGRFTCLVAERRCAACDPATGTGCAEGEVCSSFGACTADGQTCDTDESGVPTLSCSSNTDCAACDPSHQVCDPASGHCVACSAVDDSACTSTEMCVKGNCAPKCPSSCVSDVECGQCGGPGHEAHACNAGNCAACSPTFPCPGGLSCTAQGQCKDPGGSTGAGGSSGSSGGTGAGDPGTGAGDPGTGAGDPGVGGGDPGTGGGGPGGGTCHDLCSAGDAMDASCDPCVAAVCAADDYCCSTAWDSLCVNEVDQYCNNACSDAPPACAHEECAQGGALEASCSECAGAVCAADPYCCATSWDSLCVQEVAMYCASACP